MTRTRRGNYMMMFAMLLPLLLGFLALAIDVGRLRVARVQVQGAADAAALSALADLRAGQPLTIAAASASDAANAVRIQRIQAYGGTEFRTDVVAGAWDWETRTWSQGAGTPSAVTVNVQMVRPLGLIFGRLFERGGNTGVLARAYAGGAMDGRDDDVRTLSMGRRAAMRPRDIVFVVDGTLDLKNDLSEVSGHLTNLYDGVAAFQNGNDRASMVAFAGGATNIAGWERLTLGNTATRNGLANLGVCEVGMDAWFHWYRFMDSFADPELDGEPAFDYSPIWWNEVWEEDPQPRMRWPFDSDEGQWVVQTDLGFTGMAEETWENPLTEEQQCLAWGVSQLLFGWSDPRRIDMDTLTPYDTIPLSCHAGNVFEGDADRYLVDTSWDEVDCSITGWDEAYPGHAALLDGGDPDPDVDFPDPAYAVAGRNPGAGLLMAAELLAGLQPSRSEPTVVLLTTGGPACGPTVRAMTDEDCAQPFEDQLDAAVEILDNLGANTHVIVLQNFTSPEVVAMLGTNTGRGQFYVTPDLNDLDIIVDEIARDTRLQVVE